MLKKFALPELILSGIGIICGVVMIILSLSFYIPASSESSMSYGGDAYTGMQNASAQTANNVQALCDGVSNSVNIFGTIAGILIITSSLKKLLVK